MNKEIVHIHKENIENAIQKYSISESNSLIEKSFSLNKYELKMIGLLSAFVQKDDKDFKTYKFPVKGLMDYLGLANSKHEFLYNIFVEFMGKSFKGEYYDEDSDTLKTGLIGWISSISYPKNGEGIVEMSMDPKMKYYLLGQGGKFTTYGLSNIASLNSGYSNRMYRILKKAINLQGGYKSEVKIRYGYEQLRNILDLKDEYNRYFDFKKRVILKSKEELEKYTDIKFDFIEHKEGRSIKDIEFIILNNIKDDKNIEKINQFVENVTLYSKLYKIGFSQKKISALIGKYGEEEVNSSVDYVLHMNEKNIIENKIGYLNKVISDKLYLGYLKVNIPEIGKKEKNNVEEKKSQKIAESMLLNQSYKHITEGLTSIELEELKNNFYKDKVEGKKISENWKGEVDSIRFRRQFQQYVLEKYS